MRAAVLSLAAVAATACTEQRTQGDELFGSWSQVDVGTAVGQQWLFRDDLTFEKSGELTGAGTFFVEGRQLTVEDFPDPQGADRLAFNYVATTSHWLETAAFAVGPVRGRVGTWRGTSENLVDQLHLDVTFDLRADGSAHETRRVTGPDTDELCEGEGTWADSPTGSSFRVTLTIVCPDQTFTGSHQLWRLGDAIGGPLYERVSF